jgi:hypothetical protein
MLNNHTVEELRCICERLNVHVKSRCLKKDIIQALMVSKKYNFSKNNLTKTIDFLFYVLVIHDKKLNLI